MDVTVKIEGFETGMKLPDFDSLVDHLVGEMFTRIVQRTPVDTGWAQSNWSIEGHNIVNPVDYVQYLEYGWSKQAPHGMIRVTLEEAPQIVTEYLQQHSHGEK